MFQKIGFIGCGNMGSAVAKAVSKSGGYEKIYLANRTAQKAQALARELTDAIVTDNATAARECDLLFLAVKPQMMKGVLEGLPIKEGAVLCTMAAGLTMETILDMAGVSRPILRIMPNTPCAIGKGVVQYCAKDVSDADKAEFGRLMTPCGIVEAIEERLIDAASAVSGCGPAFAYLFMEALADGGVACGLPRDKAMKFAAGMLEGAAALALETGKHPGALKDAVCSPGGTTIQGVRTLEERGFRGAVMDSVIAAYEKTAQLKKG